MYLTKLFKYSSILIINNYSRPPNIIDTLLFPCIFSLLQQPVLFVLPLSFLVFFVTLIDVYVITIINIIVTFTNNIADNYLFVANHKHGNYGYEAIKTNEYRICILF